MESTIKNHVESVIKEQREFFSTHQTKDVKFRIAQLKKLRNAIYKYEKKITEALWKDLHKSYEEAYYTEVNIVLDELDLHISQLENWTEAEDVPTPLLLFPSTSKIIYEPLGVVLIYAPWNYPFQLMMNSLVGAISAGCCSIMKPSPYALNTAQVMEEIIHETFERKYIEIIQGDRKVNEILFAQRYDFIFYTGSPAVGKVVMKAAAEHLTPVVLELGGKSPCVVDASANIDVAAKRIAWGKLINAGQTCIAPDYLFVHSSVKDRLIKKIVEQIESMFGSDPKESKYYGRIINEQAFDRLRKLMLDGKIVYGGQTDRSEKYIAPTIMDEIKPGFPIMQEEIFGPLLPVMTFEQIDEVLTFVNEREKPLAFYYFGKSKSAEDILRRSTSGGACINDVLLQIANHHLPYGGVGNSGIGKYHGKASFLAFSNVRGVVKTSTIFDLPMRYAPYRLFKLVKSLLMHRSK